MYELLAESERPFQADLCTHALYLFRRAQCVTNLVSVKWDCKFRELCTRDPIVPWDSVRIALSDNDRKGYKNVEGL